MVKKILYAVISIGILAGGYIAAGKLNYLERSVRIFSYDSSQAFGGRMGRGGFERRGEFSGTRPGGERRGFREMPDSIRQRLESGRERGFSRPMNRELTDSLRRGFREIGSRGLRSEAGFRPEGARGRGEFHGGKKVNLNNVSWFLVVFSSFTVIVICIDNVYLSIRKRFIRSNR